MNRKIYYDYIAEKIEVLANTISTSSRLNLLDLNIHSESLFRDLLNILYGYNLRSSNVGKSNFEAIDLIDEENKMVVQVTSTVTTTKINDTLKKTKIDELSQFGYRLKFLFITGDAKLLRKKEFKNIYNINFIPSEDLVDKVTILESVSQLSIDK